MECPALDSLHPSMLSRVSIICFAASYGLVLGIELLRLLLKRPMRLWWVVVPTVAGLAAHTIYLAMRALKVEGGMPLSSWYDWLLVAAWVVAAAYLLLLVSRPQANIGLFLLPLVLGLIGLAYPFRTQPGFARDQALDAWGIAHGMALLVATVVMSLGFAAGVMYLLQSYRLKHKTPVGAGIRLPSLEWLQWLNRQSLLYSTFFVALGVLAGLVLNVVKQQTDRQAVPWTDSVVLTSGAMLIWLLVATAFELLYKPAQQGRKVAYLTVASFLFLAVSLGMVLAGFSAHAAPRATFAEPPQ